jgi:hypothetical protein
MAAKADTEAGVLDLPLPGSETTVALLETQPATVLDAVGDPDALQDALQEELDKEREELEELPRTQLEQRAEQGERAAQITLAEDFAEEASLLAFAPEAANDALSDAVRWYALAAQRGFPGAPSLDQAGVRFYPIRVQR